MRNRNSQIRVSKTPCLKLKCEVSWTQKGSLIAIMLSAHRRGSRKERNGFVKAKAKQVIVYKYLQDFFALKPFRDYCLCSVNIFSRRSYSTKIDIRNQSILSILIDLIRLLILIDIRNR